VAAEDCSLRLHDIAKAFSGIQALGGVSFDLRRGEVHALVGENGAGKSTLIKIVAGAYVPDSGVIELDASPAKASRPKRPVGSAFASFTRTSTFCRSCR
jgi:ABC-type sugar transport system ATPase subunit